MTSAPAVTVVFAACNHAATLRALGAALDTTDWPDLRVVAVDCGSSDGSLQLLRERAQRGSGVPFTLLELPGAGRASALNAAFAAAERTDVVRLHADVVPDAPDWLQRLHAVLAQHPHCGIVGGKIALAGGRLQSCGRELVGGLGIVPEWSDRRWLDADRDEPSRPTEVDGVAGELCWIRRAVLDQTGGLDPNFDPVFGDDDDLCLLARWHGWSVFVEPAVRGVHYAPRQSTTTSTFLADPTGQLQRLLDERVALARAHRDYFRRKWGFDPEAPDLHEVRRRYGHTRICWRIGARLLESLPPQPAVDVCLVTCNSMAVLPRALQHLAATRWPAVTVWITDNGSTDGTLEYLERQRANFPFPLHVERFAQNAGVAPALNAAFVRGRAPLVARIDDDTLVSPEWLERLVPRFHQRPYAGLVGPMVLHDRAGTALQCGPSRSWPEPFHGTGDADADRCATLGRVVAMRGCCNVYRRSVFATVGLLDVRFAPSQFDEWDHHIAVAVAGYEALYDGSVQVRHLLNAGRQATPAGFANMCANRAKSNAKWGGNPWRALDRAIDLSIDGRFLPPDGDTAALRALLPPVPPGPPVRPTRDPAEVAALVARGRRRSLLRSLDGPLRAWWEQQLELAATWQANGDSRAGAIVAKVVDLLPQEPRALLLAARHRAAESEPAATALLARSALRLRPDDAHVQAAVAALLAPPPVPIPRPAAVATPPAGHVLLVPPLDPSDAIGHTAAALAHAALQALGVPATIDRRLRPDPRGSAAVHCFGLGEASVLVGRLQAMRAMAPPTRIVLSSLQPDPAAANWIGRVLQSCFTATAADQRRILRAAAAGELLVDGQPGRRLATPPDVEALDYARACLRFVDALVVHDPAELAWQRQCHGELPPAELVAEGVPADRLLPTPDDDEVPFGGALALGPRDLPGHHLAMVLALADSGLPLSLCGPVAHPYGEWHTRPSSGAHVHWLQPRTGDAARRALARSAVCLWLPSSPASFAIPLQAAAAGCELVLARDQGAEAIFGDHAHYVDPCDLPALRAATLAAAVAWQPDADPPWRRALRREHGLAAYGRRLLAVYGLPQPLASPTHSVFAAV